MTASDLAQTGLENTLNFDVWPVGGTFFSFDLGQYLLFTLTPNEPIDFTKMRYTGRSYFESSLAARVRTSLDGFVQDVDSATTTNTGGRSFDWIFDLSALQGVNGPIEFRIYPSNSGPAERDFIDISGSLDGGVGIEVYGVPAGTGCKADQNTLCIDGQPGDSRFKVTMSYDTTLGGGQSGNATPTVLTPLGIDQGGILWFFDPGNPEVLVKVINGCDINSHYWLFYAATTTVGFDLTVRDTQAGQSKIYTNPDRSAAEPITDTSAFATCP